MSVFESENFWNILRVTVFLFATEVVLSFFLVIIVTKIDCQYILIRCCNQLDLHYL